MNDHCASCGSTDRQEFEYQKGGTLLRNDYCGNCGATWGYRVKRDAESTRTSKRQPEPSSGFSRVSNGMKLPARRPSTNSPRPFAEVAGHLPYTELD